MQLQLQMQSTWSFALCNSQLPITVPPIAIGARRGLLQVRSSQRSTGIVAASCMTPNGLQRLAGLLLAVAVAFDNL